MAFGKKKRQINLRRKWLSYGIYICLLLTMMNVGLSFLIIHITRSHTVQVTLPNYYSENMVFQHNKLAYIHGQTAPNTQLSIKIGNNSTKTTADATGKFSVYVSAPPARLQPYQLTIADACTNRELKRINKVYSGNVFLMSGQSNMELGRAVYYGNAEAIRVNTYDKNEKVIDISQLPKPINDANVHFLVTKDISNSSNLPLQDINKSGWASADNTKNTDWLGFLPQQFALNMRKAEPNIPIGIIQTAWGATNISRHMTGGDIYTNHITPLSGFNIAGILWYQGEADANTNDAPKYAERLSKLIDQYRTVFGNDASLPFIQFQLANFKYSDGYWGDIRKAQAQVSASRNNVALINAAGTERGATALIHPLGKDTLGEQAAKEMLNLIK